jgi:hypothetical protein
MNDNFVIEEKWNHSVGLICVDNTVKLVRHYEYIVNADIMSIGGITIDVYENGMIKCHSAGRMHGIDSKPFEQFTINITDGEKLDDTYIDRIDSIFKPYCERLPNSAAILSRTEYDTHFYKLLRKNEIGHCWNGELPDYGCSLWEIQRYMEDKFDWNNPKHVKKWEESNGPLYQQWTLMHFSAVRSGGGKPVNSHDIMIPHVMDGLNALKAQYKAEQDKLTQLKNSYELKIQQLQNEIQQLTKTPPTTKHSEPDVQKTIDEITTTIYDLIYDSDNNSDSTVEYQEVDDLLDLSFSESCGDQTTKQNLCGIKAIERYEKHQSKYSLKNKKANINMTFQDNNKISPIWI